MATFEKLTTSQKVRASLHRDVRAICSETCHFLGLEVTKSAMEIIAELVFKKLSVYGTDLEAFAKHAKRATINSEDVKLLVRRNSSLLTHLNSVVPTASASTKRRKTTGKPQETPAKTKKDSNKNKEVSSKVPDPEDKELEKEMLKEIEKDFLEDKEEFADAMIVDNTIDLTFD